MNNNVAMLKSLWMSFLSVGLSLILGFALPGSAFAQDERAWIQQLASDAPTERAEAAKQLVDSTSSKIDRRLLFAIGRSDDPVKVELLRILRLRKVESALETASDLTTNSRNKAVRAEALRVVGALGNAEDLPLLASVSISSPEEIREVAREAMMALPEANLGDVLAQGLMNAHQDPMRFELARLAGLRNIAQAVPELLHLANSAGSVGPETRRQCLEALGQMAKLDHLEPLMVIYASEADEKALEAAGNAVRNVVLRHPEKGTTAVLAAHEQSTGRARAGLLRLLSELGGDAALERVRADAVHEKKAIQMAALLSMMRWPDASPAEDLRAVAADEDRDVAMRDAAYLGYLKMILLAGEEARPGMLETAEKLAADNKPKLKALDAVKNGRSPSPTTKPKGKGKGKDKAKRKKKRD